MIADKHGSSIERGCHDFAYCFLVGEYGDMLKNIEPANVLDDDPFDLIKTISKNSFTSNCFIYKGLIQKSN